MGRQRALSAMDEEDLPVPSGHKTHLTLDVVNLARTNNIILLCLPPHTTRALQPLNVSVFKSLKAHFSRSLHPWCFIQKDFVVTKRDFTRVVKEPFESSFSMSNIKRVDSQNISS